MKLRYKILIFDNEPGWVNGIKGDLAEIVEDEGFIIDLEKDIISCESESDFLGNYDDYDIILIDYDLGREKGQNIIKNIRECQHYTEVIFYTQGPEDLLGIISREQIEGVYCCRRESGALLNKFGKVFRNSIKKVLDLNNLRGLVMSETSELDNLKKEILYLIWTKNLVNSNFFKINVYPLVTTWCEEKHRDSKKYLGKKIKVQEEDSVYSSYNEGRFINDFLFDSDKKGKAISKALMEIGLTNYFEEADYQERIQRKRNKLAHEPERIEENKLYFGDYEFTYEEAKKLREDIVSYKRLFSSIITEINRMK